MSDFWMSDADGGADADRAVGKITGRLKTGLKKLNAKSYSTVLKEFGIKLWVSGEISRSKESNGSADARIYATKKMVSFRIVMNHDIWEEGPAASKEFLQRAVLTGFQAVAEKAAKKKIPLDRDRLLKDVERVLRK